jgi:hypothetical protein
MFQFLLLVASTFGHLHMTQPLPSFTNGPGNQNAPSSICSLVQYTPSSASAVLAAFKGGMSSKFPDIKTFVEACGGPKCGNTVASHIVPVPSENIVKINVGARHVGPIEIWIDDTRVVQSDTLEDSYNVDFGRWCKGECHVRMVMVALHVFPAELYDNCVIIRGGGGVVQPGRRQDVHIPSVVVTSTIAAPPAATELPQQPTPETQTLPPVSTQEENEWSCSKDHLKLIRTVGNVKYEFECAAGTVCKPVDGLTYPVCQHK